MKYNFEKVINRKNTESLKWDINENVLPLWVADMDFEVAPEIKAALEKRLSLSVYGYTITPDKWYEAYQRFYLERHGLTIEKDELLFSAGVVPTISSAVRAFTKEGDHVVVLPPVYNIFYNSIRNNNRVIHEVPLLLEDGKYFIDWKGLEEAFALENTKMVIFCNPGNPVSRIWSKEELAALGALARKYDVTVLSDEIHGEITRPGTSYVPYLTASKENYKNSLTAISVTKAFNLAGIQTSAIIAKDPVINQKINRQINTDEVAEGNFFSYDAAIAALNEGREWLDELREVLFDNRDEVKSFLEEHVPEVSLLSGDATYLLWIDCSLLTEDSDDLIEHLKNNGLLLSSGKSYGTGGNGFVRMNVACPNKTLREALSRFEQGIHSYHRKDSL